MSSDTPEILSTDAEREILVSRLEDAVERAWRNHLVPGISGEPGGFALSSTAVTAVLRGLRVMSARQVAVLLAAEANRHEEHVVREPPRYTAQEIGGHS